MSLAVTDGDVQVSGDLAFVSTYTATVFLLKTLNGLDMDESEGIVTSDVESAAVLVGTPVAFPTNPGVSTTARAQKTSRAGTEAFWTRAEATVMATSPSNRGAHASPPLPSRDSAYVN